MAGTPNWLIMAIIIAVVTTLFSEGALEFWGNFRGSFGAVRCWETFSGTCDVVEFLDCNFSTDTWYVVAPVVQEAEIVVLQV